MLARIQDLALLCCRDAGGGVSLQADVFSFGGVQRRKLKLTSRCDQEMEMEWQEMEMEWFTQSSSSDLSSVEIAERSTHRPPATLPTLSPQAKAGTGKEASL
jgi:hypothetical protein